MPPDLASEIAYILQKCRTESGKYKSKLSRVDSEYFKRTAILFSNLLPNELMSHFQELSFGAQCHWMSTGNLTHPAPCKICNIPTKIKQDGFTATYCSVSCRSADPQWLNKRRETCLDKYGKTHATFVGQVKRKSTNLLRYGNEFAIASDEVRKKSSITMNHRYGVDNISHSAKHVEARAAKKRHNFIDTVSKEKNLIPLFNIDDYDGLKLQYKSFKWLCNNCNKTFTCRWIDYRPHCSRCEPKKSTRTIQGRLFSDIIAQGINCKFNDRTIISPLEIDLLFQEDKLCVEINGFYWHRNNDRTEEKRILAKEQGYRFMMFFEDEVQNSHDIVLSMILHKLGKTKISIGARKCKIIKLEAKEARGYINKWHLSKHINSSSYFALSFMGEIVAIASFGKNRFARSDKKIELLRFCTKPFTSIPGGLTRLVNEAKNHYNVTSIISYVDRRLDPSVPVNAIENKKGFTIWDNKLKIRKHRLAISKQAMAKQISIIDKTQQEAADELQLFKIPNLGTFKYEI